MDQLSIPAARPGESEITVMGIRAFGPPVVPPGADTITASAKE